MFWGTRAQGHVFQGNKCLNMKGTGGKRQFWGTGNIGNKCVDYWGTGEQSDLI